MPKKQGNVENAPKIAVPKQKADGVIVQLMSKIDGLKTKFDLQEATFKKVVEKARTNKDFAQESFALSQSTPMNQLKVAASKKALSIIESEIDQNFENLPAKTKRYLLTLFVIDDWSDVAQLALPLVQEYGPKLWNWIKERWFSHKESGKRQNQGTILPSISQASFQRDGMYTPQSVRPQALIDTPGIHVGNYKSSSYNYDHVNKEFVKSVINPSQYNRRRPRDQVLKTSLGSFTVNYKLTTDASGNVFWAVYPQQAFANQAGNTSVNSLNASWFWNTTSGTVPSTGAYSAGSSLIGPLNGVLSQITSWCLNSCRVEFLPQVGMNTSQGTHEIVYFQQPINNTVVAGQQPIVPQPLLAYNPFYQIANFQTTQGSDRLPTEGGDEEFVAPVQAGGQFPDGSSSCAEGFYGMLTGATPSTTIGNLRISVGFEFIPVNSQIPLSVMDTAIPGIATVKAFTNMILRCPRLQSLTTKEADDAIAKIEAAPSEFNAFSNYMCEHIESLGSRPTVVAGGGNSQMMSLPSFDQILSVD